MKQEQRIVVLLGAPGAGKGTQAREISRKHGFTHVSTGDILRDAVHRGSELGQKVQKIMEAGELVPDDLVSNIVRERLLDGTPEDTVLDGYPRNRAQAEFLDASAGDLAICVIDIRVDEEQLIKRLSGRRHCTECGRIYNIYFSPPEEQGICDACKAPLIQRKDDQEAVIRERLRVYRRQTEPLLDFYASRENFFSVNGNTSVESVSREIDRILQKFDGSNASKGGSGTGPSTRLRS